MNCEGESPACPDKDLWLALIEERISAEHEQRLQQHLDHCAACQQRLDEIVDLHRLRPHGPCPIERPTELQNRTQYEWLNTIKGLTSAGPADNSPVPISSPGGMATTIGSFQLYQPIGQGGMGIVWQGMDGVLNRAVAIKVMRPELARQSSAKSRFLREARAAAAIRHENVVQIHAVEEADGMPYIVMELVQGDSLAEVIRRRGRIEIGDALRWFRDILSGLVAAHRLKIVHRDLKPLNLLLQRDTGRIKITDFGLAKLLDGAVLTQAGAVMGTPEYMSPEQALGMQVDPRTDLYSAGAILYAMLTGSPPLHGSTSLELVARIRNESPADIRTLNPSTPTWLAAIVHRLLAKIPAERYATAQEVLDSLDPHADRAHSSKSLPPPSGAPRSSAAETRLIDRVARSIRRPSVWALGISTLAISLIGFAIWSGGAANRHWMVRAITGPVPTSNASFTINGDGTRRGYTRLEEALASAVDRDTIECTGDYELTAPLEIHQTVLTLRGLPSAEGRNGAQIRGQIDRATGTMIHARGSLILRDLEIICDGPSMAADAEEFAETRHHVVRADKDIDAEKIGVEMRGIGACLQAMGNLELVNCQFKCNQGTVIHWPVGIGHKMRGERCNFDGSSAMFLDPAMGISPTGVHQNPEDDNGDSVAKPSTSDEKRVDQIEWTQCHIAAQTAWQLNMTPQAKRLLAIQTKENDFEVNYLFSLNVPQQMSVPNSQIAENVMRHLRLVAGWEEEGNDYKRNLRLCGFTLPFSRQQQIPCGPTSREEWKEFWRTRRSTVLRR